MLLQKQTQSQLASNLEFDDEDNDPAGPDELDLHRAYRRPELVEDNTSDTNSNSNIGQDELSDYVKTRLLVARSRALAKYQEKWS